MKAGFHSEKIASFEVVECVGLKKQAVKSDFIAPKKKKAKILTWLDACFIDTVMSNKEKFLLPWNIW